MLKYPQKIITGFGIPVPKKNFDHLVSNYVRKVQPNKKFEHVQNLELKHNCMNEKLMHNLGSINLNNDGALLLLKPTIMSCDIQVPIPTLSINTLCGPYTNHLDLLADSWKLPNGGYMQLFINDFFNDFNQKYIDRRTRISLVERALTLSRITNIDKIDSLWQHNSFWLRDRNNIYLSKSIGYYFLFI